MKQQQQQRFVELIVANAGDTRVVLGAVGGQPAERLSVDHRVDDPNEVQRIAQAGGFCYKGRALGVLAVTRSLGDQLFKEFVIAQPAVRTLIVPTNAITTTTTPTTAAPVAPALDSRDPHPSVTNGENGNTTRSNNNDDDARIILPNSNPNYSGTVVDVASVPSFVILACDGLWDVMSDQEAVDLVREFPGNKRDVADQLVQEGLTRGSTDNLTVLVAWL